MKDAPNPKVMCKRMYVGGVISKHSKLFKLPLPGFEGCIRNFKVNSQPQSLLATSRDLIPCIETREISYIHDGGFATFGDFLFKLHIGFLKVFCVSQKFLIFIEVIFYYLSKNFILQKNHYLK